jgi:hypothetical protein
VPQSAILSPTLYNIFTSDVLTSEFCGTATPILVQDQLQDHLNEISVYCKDWKMKINESKTQAIFFYRCTKNDPQTEITLNVDGINRSIEVKYLGVHLDKRLTFESHISKSVEKKSTQT